jgi:hypothetical protein
MFGRTTINSGEPNEVTSSYICILAHTADETVDQNRPDQDTTGIYWNLLAGGPENNVLTTDGDLLYYSGTGPARLPLGEPGQVLKVNQTETAPEWGYLGQINNIVYVEPQEGKDEPAPLYGSTIDQPFKTIRYATSQIDNGILRPNARQLIELNTAFIQNETLQYVNEKVTGQEAGTIWEGFVNDGEFLTSSEFYEVIDAVVYDLTHAGNTETRRQTLTYFDSGSLVSTMQNENEQFVDALEYMETVIDAVLSNLELGTDIGTKRSSFTQTIDSSLQEESDAQLVIESLFDVITISLLAENTTNLPAENIPNSTVFVKTGTITEVLPIIVPENCAVAGDELRSTRIVPAGQLVENSDVSYSLDAISRLQTIIDPIVTGDGGTITPSAGNTESYVNTGLVVGSSQAGIDAAELFQQISDYIDWGINGVTGDSTEPKTAGSNTANNSTDYTYAVEAIEKNRAFLIEEAIAYIKAEYPAYDFSESAYRRDIDRYVSAVIYDLIYTGNYKSLLAAKYYVNSVLGSTAEDMFYMRNGTGLRNCTVAGLSGTLSAENAFGTKRPTAGAYVSLDPGWGPDDEDVWIKARSPYVQNVTTFGTGCVGCKIDGDLHNGGNDSIVANDFTQVISDGIGAWCTNLGRTELVSVFSYYAHIGYLAENGGKIRATNGNSSYGTFGTVAEGVDETEIPVTGQVDNRAFEASVNRVFTTGDQILTFEYQNAGQNYTAAETEFTVTGEGFNAEIDAPQTVDGGVFTIRMLDTDVTGDGEGDFGGDNYFTSQNAAQGGNTTSITLSNTEVAIPSQLFGLAIFIASGLGAGQYGVITEYNSGTKIAQIGDSAVGVIQTTSVNSSTGEITVATTSELSAGDFIRFTGTEFGGLDNSTVYEIATVVDSTTITLVSPGTLTTETGLMYLYRPGWDVLVPGVISVESTLDASTSYLIEPRVVVDPPAGGSYSDAAKARAIVDDEKVVQINIWDPGVGYTTAPAVAIEDPNNTIDAPTQARIGDGVLTQPTWINRGQAFETAQADVAGDGFADQFQPGEFVRVKGLTDIPDAGSNIVFGHLPNKVFKVVVVRQLLGTGEFGDEPPFSAQLQVSPELTISEAAPHETEVELRIRFSQVRLTGHDFLDIGTGNKEETNYPNEPEYDPDPEAETRESDGGRVFYTSTDQDGNFRVGELFSIEQSTGVATLNADAFNISGLNELSLGELGLGGTGVTITEFSADGTFAADSDSVVPTQKAIKTFITSQIGGGAASLNVNSITAGQIQILERQILTTTGNQIVVEQKMNFAKGIDGVPAALNFFLSQ